MGTEHGAAIGVWQLLVMAMPVVFVLFYFVPTIAVLRTRIGKRTRRLGFILWTLVGILASSAIGIGPVLLIRGLGLSESARCC